MRRRVRHVLAVLRVEGLGMICNVSMQPIALLAVSLVCQRLFHPRVHVVGFGSVLRLAAGLGALAPLGDLINRDRDFAIQLLVAVGGGVVVRTPAAAVTASASAAAVTAPAPAAAAATASAAAVTASAPAAAVNVHGLATVTAMS